MTTSSGSATMFRVWPGSPGCFPRGRPDDDRDDRFPTREHARRDITRYIELRYNTTRRHSALDYRTPRQVHDEYLKKQSAA